MSNITFEQHWKSCGLDEHSSIGMSGAKALWNATLKYQGGVHDIPHEDVSLLEALESALSNLLCLGATEDWPQIKMYRAAINKAKI